MYSVCTVTKRSVCDHREHIGWMRPETCVTFAGSQKVLRIRISLKKAETDVALEFWRWALRDASVDAFWLASSAARIPRESKQDFLMPHPVYIVLRLCLRVCAAYVTAFAEAIKYLNIITRDAWTSHNNTTKQNCMWNTCELWILCRQIESTKQGVQLFSSLIIYELNRDEIVCLGLFMLMFYTFLLMIHVHCLRISFRLSKAYIFILIPGFII